MSQLNVDAIRASNGTGDAISLTASDKTCTANITNIPGRNLIINGAMNVAQRGTSSTSGGYQTVDRFQVSFGGTDEAPTQAQVDVAAGTTPYTLGFRKAYKLTNGNQTGGAGATDYLGIEHHVEAQNVTASGWNYKSASSKLTLSFWLKSSVAQAFSGSIEAPDTTSNKFFKFSTASLSADTWTKVELQIIGDSNLTINNDTGTGLLIRLYGFIGTTHTSSNSDTKTWVSGTNRYADDMTSTWYTTNDSTLEMTGFQLEVGDYATDFEHKKYGDELRDCRRYFYKESSTNPWGNAGYKSSTDIMGVKEFPVSMRSWPTTTGDSFQIRIDGGGQLQNSSSGTLSATRTSEECVQWRMSGFSSLSSGDGLYTCAVWGGSVSFSSEL